MKTVFMAQYFFVLGKNPTLSIAEISSVLGSLRVSYVFKVISREILVIETKNTVIAAELMKTLGGTIKIGQVISEVGFDEDESEFEKIFEAGNIMEKFLSKKEGKIHFGVSIYDGGTDRNYLTRMVSQLKALNIEIKENLKEKGIKAGFVRIKEQSISSVSVFKNKLLSQGTEIVLILTKDKILAAKTLAVQEFESFSLRDYGRPKRDKRSGIIPPKLARMMINLASSSKEDILLDPFCGSGTILQEEILLGYKNIIGSDVSQNAVSDTKENIDWLFANFRQLDKSSYNINIYPSDVRLIKQTVKENSVDAVVTEPYLGPPLYKKPDLNTVERVFNEVGKLYSDTFFEFHKILRTGGKVIFLFPAFDIDGKMQFIPILDKIERMGFRQLSYFPEEIKNNSAINLTQRNTILYGSREHFVKREITYWQKG